MAAENIAYVFVSGLGSGNPNLGSEPASVSANFILISPDNVITQTGSSAVNFNYGATSEDIRELVVDYVRNANSDPKLSVEILF